MRFIILFGDNDKLKENFLSKFCIKEGLENFAFTDPNNRQYKWIVVENLKILQNLLNTYPNSNFIIKCRRLTNIPKHIIAIGERHAFISTYDYPKGDMLDIKTNYLEQILINKPI